MTRVKNIFSGMPQEMLDHWDWLCAVDAYYYCDPLPLAELVKSSETIPANFRRAVSEIIAGNPERQNKKAAAKIKLQASERLRIAGSLSALIGLVDTMKSGGLHFIADSKAQEPIEVVRRLEAKHHEAIDIAARDLGVHPETIEDLLRDLRKKIDSWPNV